MKLAACRGVHQVISCRAEGPGLKAEMKGTCSLNWILRNVGTLQAGSLWIHLLFEDKFKGIYPSDLLVSMLLK